MKILMNPSWLTEPRYWTMFLCFNLLCRAISSWRGCEYLGETVTYRCNTREQNRHSCESTVWHQDMTLDRTEDHSRVWLLLNLAGVKMPHFFILRNKLNWLNSLMKTLSSVIFETSGTDKNSKVTCVCVALHISVLTTAQTAADYRTEHRDQEGIVSCQSFSFFGCWGKAMSWESQKVTQFWFKWGKNTIFSYVLSFSGISLMAMRTWLLRSLPAYTTPYVPLPRTTLPPFSLVS